MFGDARRGMSFFGVALTDVVRNRIRERVAEARALLAHWVRPTSLWAIRATLVSDTGDVNLVLQRLRADGAPECRGVLVRVESSFRFIGFPNEDATSEEEEDEEALEDDGEEQR